MLEVSSLERNFLGNILLMDSSDIIFLRYIILCNKSVLIWLVWLTTNYFLIGTMAYLSQEEKQKIRNGLKIKKSLDKEVISLNVIIGARSYTIMNPFFFRMNSIGIFVESKLITRLILEINALQNHWCFLRLKIHQSWYEFILPVFNMLMFLIRFKKKHNAIHQFGLVEILLMDLYVDFHFFFSFKIRKINIFISWKSLGKLKNYKHTAKFLTDTFPIVMILPEFTDHTLLRISTIP